MEEGVTLEVIQKPTVSEARTSNESKNKVQHAVKHPPAPAPAMTTKAFAIKSINKPNQWCRSPTQACGVRRNITKPKQQLPDYIRTEMEILRQLGRVNRDLRILLKPKYERAPNTKCRQQQQHYQAVRQSAGGVVPRVGGVNCKKSQNVVSKATAGKSQSATAARTKPHTMAAAQAKARDTHKQQTEVQRMEAQRTDKKSAPKTNKRPLQRLILYFKPKSRSDDRKGAPQSKQPQDKAENQVKTESAIKCKPEKDTQKQVKQTQMKISEQKRKGGGKKSEKAVKELAEFKENLEVKDAKKAEDKLRAKGERNLKEEPRDKHERQILKQKPTEKVSPKQQSAQVQMALSQNVQHEKTIKQKMLGFGLKCLRKAKEREVEDDKSIAKQKKNQKTKPTAPTHEAAALQTMHHEPPASIQQVESALVAGKFGNCLRFFKPRKKVTAPEPPTVCTAESVLNYEMQQKQQKKKKNHKNPASHNDTLLTSLDTYPAYSYVNLKYMKNLKATSKEQEARRDKRSMLMGASNRRIYKDPHATPSTSSLEEYFHVLSERMAREQKEADERKPMRRRPSRRGLNNNANNFNYRRAQTTNQRQYNRQRW